MDFSSGFDQERLIAFTQKIIQTPSLSLEEKEVSGLVKQEMEALGYDEVWSDELYNVVGVLKGSGGGPTLMFNGHIDHAGVGSMADPFSGKIVDGGPFGHQGPVIYGRGAVDMKGAVASMIQAGGLVKKMGLKLKGDVLVTAVSREEMAKGEGIMHLIDNGMTADFAVSGEPSSMKVIVGHRGKFEVKVSATGRTSHGGFPQGGVNAIFKMNDFLNALRERYPLPEHEFLGKATVTVLDIKASPGALTPIVPDLCEAVLDRRFMPDETEESLLEGFRAIIAELKAGDPDFNATAETLKWFPSLFTDPAEPIVKAALEARRKVLGEAGEPGAWFFGVDGTFISQAGIPCVGFGPGNEYLAHTPKDVVPVDQLLNSCKVYAQIIADTCT